MKQQVEKQITELYEQGHIEEAEASQYAHPIVCIKKRGTDKIRLCCEMKAINPITISDEYPMADLTELIDTAADARYVSTIDLNRLIIRLKWRKIASTSQASVFSKTLGVEQNVLRSKKC